MILIPTKVCQRTAEVNANWIIELATLIKFTFRDLVADSSCALELIIENTQVSLLIWTQKQMKYSKPNMDLK